MAIGTPGVERHQLTSDGTTARQHPSEDGRKHWTGPAGRGNEIDMGLRAARASVGMTHRGLGVRKRTAHHLVTQLEAGGTRQEATSVFDLGSFLAR
jgi:hypothetical protein